MMPDIKRTDLLRFLICFLLVISTLTAFWKVQHNDFINLDDNLYITENPYVRKGLTFKNLLWTFAGIYACHWHPVTWVSHMLDVELFGLHPGRHHLTNLIFHIINSLLLFFLFHKITGKIWQSAFIASLFALHPLRVESVAWAAERKDVLCAFFFFLTIYAYIRYLAKMTAVRYLLILLFFAMALMSKPMAVTLPFVLLLLDYWPLGRYKLAQWKPIVRLLIEKIPLFLFTALMSIFTYINHLRGGAVAFLDNLPFGIRIGNASISYVHYMSKMFWPDSLAVLYPHPIHLSLWNVIGALFIIMFITLFVTFFIKEHPYLVVGWFWYLGTLIPVIGVVQAGIQAMADRFTYIPMIGLLIMMSFGFSNILMRWRLVKITFIFIWILILLTLAILTRDQVGRWRDSATLFVHTLNVTSNNYLIHNNLGVTLMREGKYAEALIHYRKSLEIKPNHADAYHNLGSLFYIQGNLQEALQCFTQALKLSPGKAETLNAIGGILEKQGKLKEATVYFSEAVQINNDYGEAHYNLGTCYLKLGKIQEALQPLQHSIRINPKEAKAHHNFALALQYSGKTEEALTHFRKSLQIDPNHVNAHFCLALLLFQKGREEEAIYHFHETLRINPMDQEAHYQLGNAYIKQKKHDRAQFHLKEALKINPQHGKAHFALGEVYLIMGKKDLASRQYSILVEIDRELASRLYSMIKTFKD